MLELFRNNQRKTHRTNKAGFRRIFHLLYWNSAHAGSVILDSILLLESGFFVDNSALLVPFCYLSILLRSNPRVTKNVTFIS